MYYDAELPTKYNTVGLIVNYNPNWIFKEPFGFATGGS